MKKVILFSRAYLPAAIVSAVLIFAGIAGYFAKGGFNLGVDFQAGFIQEVQFAPAAFSVTYAGRGDATINFTHDAVNIIISGANVDGVTHNFPFARYATLNDLQNAMQTEVEGLSVTLKASGAIRTAYLVQSAQGTPELGESPFTVHYLEPDAQPIPIDQVRAALADLDVASIQILGAPNERRFLIRIDAAEAAPAAASGGGAADTAAASAASAGGGGGAADVAAASGGGSSADTAAASAASGGGAADAAAASAGGGSAADAAAASAGGGDSADTAAASGGGAVDAAAASAGGGGADAAAASAGSGAADTAAGAGVAAASGGGAADTAAGAGVAAASAGGGGETPGKSATLDESVRGLLQKTFGGGEVAITRSDFVGSRFSKQLADQAGILLSLTLLLILIYASVRFKPQFAIGAVLAIAHDALIMVAYITWSRMEFNTTTIAAILTILGYSINDTIVIFDRVKETRLLYPDDPFRAVLDRAVTETLSRTIITTLTTMLAVLSLYIFTTRGLYQSGIDAAEKIRLVFTEHNNMKDFALSLLIGMISGVYSTIFIACGWTLFWENTFKKPKTAANPAAGAAGFAADFKVIP